jgi:carbonic anhydrase
MLKPSLFAALFLLAFALFLAAQQPVLDCGPITSDPVAALVAGNNRFRGTPAHLHQSVACVARYATSQKPFAVILSCSDSRVPPEVAFDLGISDLFVVREAGNVATPGVLGSIEYATDPKHHLGVKLVVVMGHRRCGAVEAAFCPKPPIHIETLWTLIRPAVPEAWRLNQCKDPVGLPLDRWDTAAKSNVFNMVKKVEADLKDRGIGGVSVVPAFYNTDDGEITLPLTRR